MKRYYYLLLLMCAPFAALAVDHENLRIEWDPASLRLVSEKSAYARIIRLRSGDLLCCYQRAGQIHVRRSRDDGDSWGGEVTVTDYRHGVAANPELRQLNDGSVLLCYNERPRVEGRPYAIMTGTSKDEGRTGGAAERLFTAGLTKDEGCWEPVALQYPDGEVQVFFANEKPYTRTNEQEVSMISTREPSKVWTVSRRDNARDGMPVPCLLNDGQTVVIAIEDSKWGDRPGRMKPAILYSTVKTRWREGTIPGDGRRRHYALKETLSPMAYLGAPYIVQMPAGATVLSAQLEDEDGVQQMVVYLGDDKARGFTNGSRPFPMAGVAAGRWNSLFVKNDDTITAISGTRINGVSGIWTIDGSVTPVD